MSDLLKRVIERRNALWQEAKEHLDAVEARGRETSADVTKWNAISDELDQYDNRIGALQAKAGREADNARAIHELGGDVPNPVGDHYENDAFHSYLRDGNEGELRAQGVGTGTGGGFLVPEGFRAKVTERLKFFGGVRSAAEVLTTNEGNDLPWPTNDDTGNVGAILGENVQVVEQDVTLGQKVLGAYKYTSKMTRVSIELTQDSGINFESWLARKHAERIGRAQNPHFTTGTGTAQPEGIVTGATSGVTAASTTAVTTDELIDLVHSVDPAYREELEFVAFMMSDTTFASIRKLKDTNGNYLVEPDVQRGIPNTLFGYRVIINNDMAAPAAGTIPVLFGHFRAGYVIRDVRDFALLRFTERYGDFFQIGFTGFWRSDGLVQDAFAYRALTMAAV